MGTASLFHKGTAEAEECDVWQKMQISEDSVLLITPEPLAERLWSVSFTWGHPVRQMNNETEINNLLVTLPPL